MQHVNLIPTSRKKAIACACRCRQWATGTLLYLGALVATYIVAQQVVGDKSVALAEAASTVSEEMAASNRLQGVLTKSIASAQWQLDTTRFIGRHPDWSILLTIVARQLGDDVVLDNLLLAPVKAGGETPGRPKTRPDGDMFLVEMTGMAQSQPAVASFVLRLEKSGLFDRVRLVGTQRQAFLTGSAVTFRLECSLEGKGGS